MKYYTTSTIVYLLAALFIVASLVSVTLIFDRGTQTPFIDTLDITFIEVAHAQDDSNVTGDRLVDSGTDELQFVAALPSQHNLTDSANLMNFTDTNKNIIADSKEIATYYDSYLGVRLQYPANWIREDYFDGVFVAPMLLETETDKSVGFDLVMFPLRSSSLGEEFNRIMMINNESLDNLDIIEKTMTNFTNRHSNETHLAYNLVYTYDSENGPIKAMEIITMIDDIGFSLLYQSEPEDYAKHLQTVKGIIESFELVPKIDSTELDARSRFDVRNFTNRGIDLFLTGSYEEALSYFDNALAIDPNYIYALLNKGNTLSDLGREQDAISYFDKALTVDPNNPDVLNSKGISLAHLGNYKLAISYYDKTLSTDPKHVESLYNKAIALSHLGEYDEAILYYDKVLEIDPSDTEALLRKGIALAELRDNEESLKVLESVLEIEPDNAEALGYKGMALSHLGRYDEAIGYLNKSLSIEPSNPTIEEEQYATLVSLQIGKELEGSTNVTVDKESYPGPPIIPPSSSRDVSQQEHKSELPPLPPPLPLSSTNITASHEIDTPQQEHKSELPPLPPDKIE